VRGNCTGKAVIIGDYQSSEGLSEAENRFGNAAVESCRSLEKDRNEKRKGSELAFAAPWLFLVPTDEY
jgi:hypothetical protein